MRRRGPKQGPSSKGALHPKATLVHAGTQALPAARRQVNKRLKEEAKTKDWEEDQRLMVQYADMLEKQERARKVQLERLKAVQARQAEDAASRPEAKTWIDPGLIDKYLR